LSLTLLLSLFLAATPENGPTVATVDGVRITAKELQSRLEARRQRGEKVGVEEVAQSLVDEVLLAAEAERRKLQLPPDLAAQVDAARRRLAGQVHLENSLEAVTPDEEMVRSVFHLNADSVRFKLLVYTNPAAAEAARGRLQKGAAFEEEAKGSLHAESSRAGGDMGLRSRGQLPDDLARVAFAAPLGQLHGPVPLDLGVALVQVQSRTIGTEVEFQARRAKSVEFARQQLRGAARQHFLKQLRAKEKVVLDEPFLLSTGASTDLAQGEKVIATVAGRPLRYGDLLEYLNDVFKGRPQGHAFGASVKVEMANTMIDDLVLEADAVKAGVDRSPAVAAQVAPLKREALATALAQTLRDGAPVPTALELAEWHRAHLQNYRVPAARACRALVLGTTEEATAARRRLDAGEPFAAVARAVSLDQASAARGGDLGDVSFDSLAAMEREPAQAGLAKAFRTAPAGVLTGPVVAGGGQYLLRCEAVRPERVLPLSEVLPDVTARARAEAGQRALDSALAGLRATARIFVDREAVLRAAPSPH
jgi:peptidyl-prolyl cis-trans isomerase C